VRPLALCLLLVACGDDPSPTEQLQEQDASADLVAPDRDEEPPPPPTQSEPIQVVPGDGLPEEAVSLESNNNLDVVIHDDRFFLAYRTGPSHFASPDVIMTIVSSTDQESWDFEASFTMETDLREPRFLSYDGRLFLYFALLGADLADFEPQGMVVTEYNGPGDWSEAEPILEEGMIPWRTKVIDGVPYMIAYIGGENIYDFTGDPIEVYWLTTSDGRNWVPVVEDQPIVTSGGVSETAFVLLDDGTLIAVGRNEAGDENGFGSNICRAEADNLGEWNCLNDPNKYDSPLMFIQDGVVYLIGRRNVTEDGHFDLHREGLTQAEAAIQYLLAYSNQRKRCALWRVDPESLEVSFIDDLPSRGDTCFPGIVRTGDNELWVYNYTSALDGPDVRWIQGQNGHTLIYRLLLDFSH
jgi:hypothetical protein